jgi:hypothetical protein
VSGKKASPANASFVSADKLPDGLRCSSCDEPVFRRVDVYGCADCVRRALEVE